MIRSHASAVNVLAEIEEILKAMLAGDVPITARAVARNHSSISAASSITRNPERLALLEKYQGMQNDFRGWQRRLPKRPAEEFALKLSHNDEKLRLLERKTSLLTASHAAMMRVIGEIGGYPKWFKIFAEYNDVREELISVHAMPRNPIKVEFPTSKPQPKLYKAKRRKT